ncbi:membrane protein insertion efficiency factor YidD [Galactobacter valiniphilus]|uniref:Putative membrane protein insertion efficiency factor n=1 Tax=Galactobacter valiniphilus TaxID=2676122 RepID=A0A399JAT4_9MICC|nr:membrane protein insertion efficiency factor YidD [Galactobacter valiniphilus]
MSHHHPHEPADGSVPVADVIAQLGPAPLVPADQVPPTPWWRHVVDLPRNLIIGFLKLYRLIVSPLYGQVCGYFPSCSAYGLEAVTVHGALKGSWLTARRILRCNPWAKGGIDPVPPGRRIWSQDAPPKIIVLNHPPLDEAHPAAAAARGA